VAVAVVATVAGGGGERRRPRWRAAAVLDALLSLVVAIVGKAELAADKHVCYIITVEKVITSTRVPPSCLP
jgi:hypothetical protein